MKQITSILIGAGLRGGYVYSQYALDHPDEFKVIAVAEPDQERRELFAAKLVQIIRFVLILGKPCKIRVC